LVMCVTFSGDGNRSPAAAGTALHLWALQADGSARRNGQPLWPRGQVPAWPSAPTASVSPAAAMTAPCWHGPQPDGSARPTAALDGPERDGRVALASTASNSPAGRRWSRAPWRSARARRGPRALWLMRLGSERPSAGR
jgi:hypothetical protein